MLRLPVENRNATTANVEHPARAVVMIEAINAMITKTQQQQLLLLLLIKVGATL